MWRQQVLAGKALHLDSCGGGQRTAWWGRAAGRVGKAPGAGVRGLHDLGGARRRNVLGSDPKGSERLPRSRGLGGWRSMVAGVPVIQGLERSRLCWLGAPKVWGPAARVPPSPSFRFLGQFGPAPGSSWPWGRGGGGNWEWAGGQGWLRSPRLFPPPLALVRLPHPETSLLTPFTSPRRTALVALQSAASTFPLPPGKRGFSFGFAWQWGLWVINQMPRFRILAHALNDLYKIRMMWIQELWFILGESRQEAELRGFRNDWSSSSPTVFSGFLLLQPRDLVESWQCPLWKTGTWCKPWEKVPMESEFESVLPTFTLALVFCLHWVHIHCSGIVYLNTVAPKRTDLCMQIPKLWETEATQSFVRVNCLFFLLFGGGGGGWYKTAKQNIFSLKFRDFWSRFSPPIYSLLRFEHSG